jgi:hypothetical protein
MVMTMITNSAAQRDWVVRAAERAEARSRGQIPSPFRQTDRSTVSDTPLEMLIAAVLNSEVTRKELCRLAQALKG